MDLEISAKVWLLIICAEVIIGGHVRGGKKLENHFSLFPRVSTAMVLVFHTANIGDEFDGGWRKGKV